MYITAAVYILILSMSFFKHKRALMYSLVHYVYIVRERQNYRSRFVLIPGSTTSSLLSSYFSKKAQHFSLNVRAQEYVVLNRSPKLIAEYFKAAIRQFKVKMSIHQDSGSISICFRLQVVCPLTFNTSPIFLNWLISFSHCHCFVKLGLWAASKHVHGSWL